MTGRVAAVTGGTGFLGRNCVVALAAAGWRVRLLTRREPTHPLLARIPLDLVLGSLEDEAALSRLVTGAEVLVHAAGVVKAGSPAAFQATNAAGTARLAGIVARDAPGCRFVHVSSQAARHPGLSSYAASKLDSEKTVASALTTNPWVILRPAIVYGPWDESTVALLRLAAGSIVPVPSRPEPRLAMVHASDAGSAVAHFCEPGPQGLTYEVCDGAAEGHAWRDIVLAARGSGAPRFVAVPGSVLKGAGAAADAWSALTGHALIFSRGKAREFLQRDWRPDPALSPPASLWTPKIVLRAGMRETLAWWKPERPVAPGDR